MIRTILILLAVALPSSAIAKSGSEKFCDQNPNYAAPDGSFHCVGTTMVDGSVPVAPPAAPPPVVNVASSPTTGGAVVMTNSGPSWEEIAKSHGWVPQTPPAPPASPPQKVVVTKVEEPSAQAFVESAAKVPWRGGHDDPLTAMVDPNPGEPMTCNQAPAFRTAAHIRVQNYGSRPGRLYLNGNEITIFALNNSVQTGVVEQNGNNERHSIIYPGQQCFVQVPKTAYGLGTWTVTFIQDGETGPAGHPMQIDGATLHSTLLQGGIDQASFPVTLRGQLVDIRFGPNEGIY